LWLEPHQLAHQTFLGTSFRCPARSRILTEKLSGLFLTLARRPFCSTSKTAFPDAVQADPLRLVNVRKTTACVAVPCV